MNWLQRKIVACFLPTTFECGVCYGTGIEKKYETTAIPVSGGEYRAIPYVCWSCHGTGRIAVQPERTA